MILAAILVALVSRMDVAATILGTGVDLTAEPSLLLSGVQSAVSMFLLESWPPTCSARSWCRPAPPVPSPASTRLSSTGPRLLTRKLLAAYVFMLIAIIFGFGGLDAFVCIFTLMPIGMEIFRQNDMPRRLLPGVLFAGVTTAVRCPAPR